MTLNGRKIVWIAVAGSLLFATAAFGSAVSGLSTTNISNDVTLTQLILSKPSDALAGDVLIANVSVNGGYPAQIIQPTGWALITRSDNDTNISVASYYKVVAASEPSTYTWNITPQTHAAGGITRYIGVGTTSPIDAFATSSGHGTVATAPSITTASDNERVIVLTASDTGANNTNFFSTSSGMIKLYDARNTPFGPTTAAEDMLQAIAGSVSSVMVTISQGKQHDWVAQTIALRSPPTCTLSVSPEIIQQGDSATLNFNSSDTSGGSINNGVGPVSSNGSVTISPTGTTTYTGTFTGINGNVTCSVIVPVTPAPPSPISFGGVAYHSSCVTGTSCTYPVSVAGSNPFLTCQVLNYDSAPGTVIMTYNGVNMTEIGHQQAAVEAFSNSHVWTDVFYIAAPPTGTHDLILSSTNEASNGFYTTCGYYNGVAQSSPIDINVTQHVDSQTIYLTDSTSVDSVHNNNWAVAWWSTATGGSFDSGNASTSLRAGNSSTLLTPGSALVDSGTAVSPPGTWLFTVAVHSNERMPSTAFTIIPTQ